MEKKGIVLFIAFLFLTSGIIFISAAVDKTRGWESSSDIFINMQIPDMHSYGAPKNFGANLQQAVTSGITGWYDNKTDLLMPYPYSAAYTNCTGCRLICGGCGTRSEGWGVDSSVPGCGGGMFFYDSCCPGHTALYQPLCKGIDSGITSLNSLAPTHNASEIWVSVSAGEMTLYAALSLSSQNRLCPANPLKTNYTSHPDSHQAYHFAKEVEITISGIKMSLQDAIDNGYFCAVRWQYSSWSPDICYNNACGQIQTRSATCVNSVGTPLPDSSCSSIPLITTLVCPSCTWGSTGGGVDYTFNCPGQTTNCPGGGCSTFGAGATCCGAPDFFNSCNCFNVECMHW